MIGPVDFSSDPGEGLGGEANGVADGIDQWGRVTNAVGVNSFSATERETFESKILSRLNCREGCAQKWGIRHVSIRGHVLGTH